MAVKEVEQDVKVLGRNLILILSGLHQGRILILTPGVLHEKHTVQSEMWILNSNLPQDLGKESKTLIEVAVFRTFLINT